MADTAVHMFVDNLVQLMASNRDWILPVKDLLLSLHGDIVSMSKYLKETEGKRLDNPKVNNLVREIIDAVVEAESIIDSFVVDAMTVGVAPDLSSQLESVMKEMEAIKAEMNDTSEIVSLDKQVDHIIGSFDDGKNLQMISIVGFPGIGKTTLAREIYNDIRVKEYFPIRAWVAVSQTYDRRGLLFDIMQSSSLFEDKDTNSSNEVLAERLFRRLKGKRYLIVMDDIWSIDAWDNVQRSFPAEHNGSKVMLTSRQAQVGKAAGKYHSGECTTHYVYGLSEEKSWELFQSKVFRNQETCPIGLEEIGRQIVEKCAGVPLSVVLVGGFLSKVKKQPEIWNDVAERLNSTFSSIEEVYMSSLDVSYRDLPFHLKVCILYLGSFPEDYEISVSKLIWLIIAEGFVVQDKSDYQRAQVMKSLEGIAQGYLDDLAERSLLIISRKSSDGATKSFQIHDLLRDFCRAKGKQETFLCQIFDEHQFTSSALDKHRRLFISDHAYQKVSLQPYARRLRSLVCFGSNLDTDSSSNRQVVFNEKDYKYLKVLDLLSFRFPFPDDIGNLIHLKYLALSISSNHNPIPESISNLFNLETLILLGTLDTTCLLPLSFWKMTKLRHLYSKALIFHFCPGSNSILANLKTLQQLCACHTCVKMLERTPGIRKLGMRGNLISPSGGVTIPDFSCLNQLHSLKIVNTSHCPRTSSNLVDLSTLPASLKSLTLTNTFLKWEEILALSNLENLEVLKLLDDACVVSDETSDEEPDWDTTDLDFPGLKYLKMQRLDIAKWDDYTLSGFQSLEALVLEECSRLEMLPLDLALLSSLRRIEVTKCNPFLETRAKEIERRHEEECADNNLRATIVSSEC